MAASMKLQIGSQSFTFEPPHEQLTDREHFYTALLKSVATLQANSNETLTNHIAGQSKIILSQNGTEVSNGDDEDMNDDGDDDLLDDDSDGE